MFDFNGDGHTDSGEQFTGCQIFKDTTEGFGDRPKASGKRLDGFDKIMIALLIWHVLNLICGGR